MKIVFMGTPEFAVASLDSIYNSGYEILLVITQEDKPKNRGKKIQTTPVKERALQLGLDVFQPQKIKDDSAYKLIKSLNPDLIVVTAYGQIIPKRILDIPKLGCINVHASLLPKYRGASPIQAAILNGEKITGITTMYMAEGLDTGDIIHTIEVEISEDETSLTLQEKLADASKKILPKTLFDIKNNEAPRIMQLDSLSSYAPIISKTEGKIDFSQNGIYINNLIRAFDPWPTAYANLDEKTVKLFSSKLGVKTDSKEFGKIIDVGKDYIEIVAFEYTLKIYEIQFPNKKRLPVSEYLKGNQSLKGKFFE